MITTLDIGGAERLMVDLLPLMQDGNQVDLLLFNGVDTPFKRELINKGVHVFQLSCWKGLKHHIEVYNPINIFKLKKYLSNYDVIHTHNTACQLYVPLAAKVFNCSSAKLVTTEHSTNNRRRSISCFKHIDQWMYRNYSAIVCISDQARENIVKYIGCSERVYTVLNGVDIRRFYKPISDVTKHNNYLITMVAAIRKEKDHETVLKALALLPINYRLQFVGRDFDGRIPSLMNQCDNLGIQERVLFLGARLDVPELLEKSDVAVLSSHWEGFGLAAVEAMASGRPLIASDVGGLRDVVKGAGILFPQGDDKELARIIQYLCEHPDEYRAVAKRCQEKAKQYDISVMAEKYLQLYNELC